MADTPNIRFRGFTDDWEQRKLPEFVEFFNGLTYTPDDVRESGTLVLRSSNVKNGEIVDADNVYVESEKVTSENVKVGDIIMVVRNGSRALIGKHAEIKENMPNTVIGAFMSGIRSKHSSFVNALLDTYQFEKEIEKNMGATINQITGYMFSKMEFMIPSSAEQERIGEYFATLDYLITFHQCKCDEIKELKKFMLQKMFPQNGKKIPEIRFAGFTDDWEQRKVKDVAPLQRGFDLPAAQMDDGEYPVVMSNGVGGYHSKFKAKGPGVITGRSGTIGRLHYIEDDYWPHNTSLWVTDFKGNYPKFIYYLYQKLDLSRFGSGSGVPTLNRNDVHDVLVEIPQTREQRKIAEWFDHLDHLIILHQHQCDELKEVKKFMLHNMFPQKG